VAAGYGRLDLVLAGSPGGEGVSEVPAGEAYLGLVPAGAVLVLQSHQVTAVVHPRRLPRAVVQHEGEQPPGFRCFWQQFLHHLGQGDAAGRPHAVPRAEGASEVEPQVPQCGGGLTCAYVRGPLVGGTKAVLVLVHLVRQCVNHRSSIRWKFSSRPFGSSIRTTNGISRDGHCRAGRWRKLLMLIDEKPAFGHPYQGCGVERYWCTGAGHGITLMGEADVLGDASMARARRHCARDDSVSSSSMDTPKRTSRASSAIRS
jgi:hypothetical protein